MLSTGRLLIVSERSSFSRYFGLSFGVGLLLVCAGAVAQTCLSTSTVPVANGVGMQCINSDVTVEYDWMAPPSGVNNSLGTINVLVNGASAFAVSPAIFANQGNLVVQGASVSGGSIAVTYMAGTSPLYVDITPALDGDLLTAIVAQDASHGTGATVSSVQLGSWPVSDTGREIALPYYTQTVHYFDSLNLFANQYWDSFTSQATTMAQDTTPQYMANTSGAIAPLYEKMVLVASPYLSGVFPILHNPPSPYMQQLAGRVVFEIPSGTFAQIQSNLANLGDHGISNCVTIIHAWQNMGRDNGLPLSYPANQPLGGNSGLLAAMNTSTNMGCFAALHENYIDYYPNYPQFSNSSVALNGDGSQVYGWINQTTGIQAYVAKPGSFVANAATQSPLIHANLGTTATYLDVNSADPPWRQSFSPLNPQNNLWGGVDMDGTVSLGGKFTSFINGSTQLWAYERATHNGPVFGEGKDHWFWSGLLDGVEAQIGPAEAAGTLPGSLGSQTPLFVDFDLQVMHPLIVNHGMGNYTNWAAGSETPYLTATADAYRMQELIYGHAPSMSEPAGGEFLWSVVPRAVQEQFQVGPIAARYGLATVSNVQYDANGSWGGTSAAVAANDFTRPAVTYSNGDVIIANSSEDVLSIDGFDLPQYGWLAQGNGMLAYTALVGGVVADYAQTPTSLFANARNAADLATLGCALGSCLTAPGVGSTVPTQGEFSSLTYNASAHSLQVRWTVFQNFDATKTYQAFLHLLDANGNVVAGASAPSSNPSQPWSEGQVQTSAMTIASFPNGTYSVHGGICDTGATGEASGVTSAGCVPLFGTLDSNPYQYVLGTLTVSASSATFSALPYPAVAHDARLNMADSMINFGPIQTDGMVYMTQNPTSQVWTMRAWPRYPRPWTGQTPTIQISNSLIGMPGALLCDATTSVQPVAVAGTDLWQVNLPPAAKACQFTASGGSSDSGPQMSVSPSSLVFAGPVAVGSSSAAQTATVTNNGSSAIALAGFSVSGSGASSFQTSNNCGASLAAGASCTVTVTFAPLASGSRSAAISIAGSAGNSPQSISLLGTAGSAPTVTLSSGSITFDDQEFGTQSSTRSVSLTNTGDAPLLIGSITLTGANAASFSTSNNCPASLAAGSSCSILASFTPAQMVSLQTASIVFNTNAPTTPDSIVLSGTGETAPRIVVSAASGQGTNPTTAVLGRGTAFTYGIQGTTATAITWSLQGAGSLTAAGAYTAPATMPANPTVVVTASLTYDPTVSTAYVMTLINPMPSTYGVSPNQLTAGQTTTVTLSGAGFVPGSTVLVNGNAVPTTYQSLTSLQAQIAVSSSITGSLSIIVSNPAPGGGTSSAVSVSTVQTWINITAVSGQGTNPSTAVLSRNTTFTASVRNSSSTAITWNLQGGGSITSAGVYTAPLSMPGSTQVVVTATLVSNPSITASYTMSLIYPAPVISGVNPNPILVGQPVLFTVGGSSFTAATTIQVNGTSYPTTFLSTTSVQAQVALPISTTGPVPVTVTNPAPGGGTSAIHTTSTLQPSIGISAVSGVGTNPTTAVLGRNTTFYYSVHNYPTSSVTWSVQGAGTITSAGVYTAPSTMPQNTQVVVIATLLGQPAISTSYTMTLLKPPSSVSK